MCKGSSLQNSPCSGGIFSHMDLFERRFVGNVHSHGTFHIFFFFFFLNSFGNVKTKHTQLVLSFWSITRVITLSWWINHVFYSLCQTQYTIYSRANKLIPIFKRLSYCNFRIFNTTFSVYNISVRKECTISMICALLAEGLQKSCSASHTHFLLISLWALHYQKDSEPRSSYRHKVSLTG